jgi:hypothetical protein
MVPKILQPIKSAGFLHLHDGHVNVTCETVNYGALFKFIPSSSLSRNCGETDFLQTLKPSGVLALA